MDTKDFHFLVTVTYRQSKRQGGKSEDGKKVKLSPFLTN
jgi:hypothetical protein